MKPPARSVGVRATIAEARIGGIATHSVADTQAGGDLDADDALPLHQWLVSQCRGSFGYGIGGGSRFVLEQGH